MQLREYESWVKNIEEIKQQLAEFWQCTNTTLKWKMQFSCFSVLPGNAEAQVVWGGVFWVLILLVTFLLKISKSVHVHVKVIANSAQTLIHAFIVYVRPLLEYGSCVSSPHFKSDIDRIESVQRRFTKRLRFLNNMPYSQRLIIHDSWSRNFRG